MSKSPGSTGKPSGSTGKPPGGTGNPPGGTGKPSGSTGEPPGTNFWQGLFRAAGDAAVTVLVPPPDSMGVTISHTYRKSGPIVVVDSAHRTHWFNLGLFRKTTFVDRRQLCGWMPKSSDEGRRLRRTLVNLVESDVAGRDLVDVSDAPLPPAPSFLLPAQGAGRSVRATRFLAWLMDISAPLPDSRLLSILPFLHLNGADLIDAMAGHIRCVPQLLAFVRFQVHIAMFLPHLPVHTNEFVSRRPTRRDFDRAFASALDRVAATLDGGDMRCLVFTMNRVGMTPSWLRRCLDRKRTQGHMTYAVVALLAANNVRFAHGLVDWRTVCDAARRLDDLRRNLIGTLRVAVPLPDTICLVVCDMLWAAPDPLIRRALGQTSESVAGSSAAGDPKSLSVYQADTATAFRRASENLDGSRRRVAGLVELFGVDDVSHAASRCCPRRPIWPDDGGDESATTHVPTCSCGMLPAAFLCGVPATHPYLDDLPWCQVEAALRTAFPAEEP